MNNYLYNFKVANNEPILDYAKGSKERKDLVKELDRQSNMQVEIPIIIGGKEIRTGNTANVVMPHNHSHVLAKYHIAGPKEIQMAIDAAMDAKKMWESMPWEDRASIFLKAAELLSTKYRQLLNASTMLNQSKTSLQAEIDAACELVDFFNFNVKYMSEIYSNQPESPKGQLNRLQYRPLEGFVFAVSPFNFTSIAGNLSSAPAMMGNTIVWKPASSAMLSGYYLMQLFKEAGLPDGVINFIPSKGSVVGKEVFGHKDFAGIHFTGSTATFKTMWKQIAANIDNYVSYPRIVGETGGKDFIFAHNTADAENIAVNITRGAFEYQGQKCSAASRAYVPKSLWGDVLARVKSDVATIKMGDVQDFSMFMGAVIDEAAFDSISAYIDQAKKSDKAEVVIGGGYDKSKGYFIEPTLIVTTDPNFVTMEEEIFGPVMTVYVYEDEKFEETLTLCDETSPYALTGAVFAKDRNVVNYVTDRLQNAAGNFYINDKPTGAVVGQQPFGGARGSGTNDKAGSSLNLIRWASPRNIKETFVPYNDFTYPYMK